MHSGSAHSAIECRISWEAGWLANQEYTLGLGSVADDLENDRGAATISISEALPEPLETLAQEETSVICHRSHSSIRHRKKIASVEDLAF